jgi:segregation and condensation protein B
VKNLARIVEALLFTAQGPLKIDSVVEAVPEADREAVEAAIEELRYHYERSSRAFQVVRIAGGYQLLTRPDVAPWVEKFLVGRRRQRLSRAALEVLSVVAYRQPVTRGEVEAIRGVDCGGVFHTLLERGLVAVKGRAKRVGNPLLYTTTDRFMEHFGIEDISELPKMEEFEALLDRDAARAELQDAGVIPRAIEEDAPPAEDLVQPTAELPEPTPDSEKSAADVQEPVANSPGEGIP